MNSKPNIMLVHGAWADGSSWSNVIGILQKKDYSVTALQLPLTSLDDDVALTKHALAEQQGPVVLVGHSYGGVVISNAATDEPKVTALVYAAAFGLDEGESIESVSRQGPPPAGAAHIHPDDRGFLWIDREGFPEVFASDMDPDEARILGAVQKPLNVKAFTQKSGPPAWKQKPSWYVVSSNDQMIPPAAEQFFAQRMGATVRTVPASHLAIVSHAAEIADTIMQAANGKH